MIFPHEDPEFSNLVRIVAKNRKLSLGLVEKDYWITHSLGTPPARSGNG